MVEIRPTTTSLYPQQAVLLEVLDGVARGCVTDAGIATNRPDGWMALRVISLCPDGKNETDRSNARPCASALS